MKKPKSFKEAKVPPQIEARKCQEEIQVVLKKHKCLMQPIPQWRARDDGTFSLVVNVSIVPDNRQGLTERSPL